jgi:hypothetical protein
MARAYKGCDEAFEQRIIESTSQIRALNFLGPGA